MTASQKLELRASEIRSRLNELSGPDSLTDEQTGEVSSLSAEYGDVETRRRAAIIAEDAAAPVIEPGQVIDTELRERLDLRGKARITNFLSSYLTGRKLDGVDAEFSAACEARGDIPLELFDPDPRLEERTVTSAPGTVGVNMAPIQPAIFAPSIAAYMGIDMPMVQSGTFGQARISTSLTAAAKNKGSAAAATEASFTVGTATPKRISARLDFQIEDVASAGVANFEAALRANLQMALSAELDDQFINGNGTAPNLTGLIEALADPTTDTSTLSFDHGLSKLADLIDGLWATETSHVRQVVGVDTFKLAAKSVSVPATGGKGEMTLADYLKAHSGGFRTNSRMPATASTKQSAIAFRSGVSGVRTAVSPHWGRLGISDHYSGSAKAETQVNFHVLCGNVIVVQPAAYTVVQYKVS